MALIVEKHKWQPSFPDETWIIDGKKNEQFQITLKQEDDIEIEFTWDYGYGGKGTGRMLIPVQLLKNLIDDLSM